ncbi:DUF5615 family PIN-like protein [Cyanobacterium sp. IPPAS B-1200]|uniref:DUF5615 family PIN-like protein n=1 Tax=Cyanobacterium sp. IPPAS B-1200 TaxID=1562720 RepID=UPI001F56379E|nr:DUF5615 family PIN-like protein [Cyanobacterium sp. IPPAS B-1200]
MRFYANENLPSSMVNDLRELNHDVLTSYEAGNANQGIPDDLVLTYASANQRIVITMNRDDFINLHHSTMNHKGIIICKANRNYRQQVLVIHEFITKKQDSWENKLIRVLMHNQPKSAKPIFILREYTK